jgi:hypothetical protein
LAEPFSTVVDVRTPADPEPGNRARVVVGRTPGPGDVAVWSRSLGAAVWAHPSSFSRGYEPPEAAVSAQDYADLSLFSEDFVG